MLNQIQQLADWQTLTAEQIHSALAAKTHEVRDPTVVTIGDLSDRFIADPELGIDSARLVIGTIQAAAAQDPIMAATFTGMSVSGIQLHQPYRQEMVDQLAVVGEWPDELRDAVKTMRVRMESQWIGLGGDGEVPDVNQIQIALDAEIKRIADEEARIEAEEHALAISNAVNAATISIQSAGNDKRTELAQRINTAINAITEASQAEGATVESIENVATEQLEAL